jgi:predicted permease
VGTFILSRQSSKPETSLATHQRSIEIDDVEAESLAETASAATESESEALIIRGRSPTPINDVDTRNQLIKRSRLKQAAANFLQPAVIAVLVGIAISLITPLRTLLVDENDRDDDAALEWLFDGIYNVGRAAVPLNIMILVSALLSL